MRRRIGAAIILVLLFGIPFINWRLGAVLWLCAMLIWVCQGVLGLRRIPETEETEDHGKTDDQQRSS